ncbi:MAG TPA: molybdopterin molybdenumtransferase MoeA [Opitutae bacterium]|nr:molybdopterin molybdenumtransferase MoeA [Opitutaceae bacterium]HCR30899.1 molybdopterin molybdenumtransferase MoeA [Opitutae bacterium]
MRAPKNGATRELFWLLRSFRHPGLAKPVGILNHLRVITVEEAQTLIQENVTPMARETVSIESCLNRVLAEPLLADRDLPPFNRSTFDGFAIASTDASSGTGAFSIVGVGFAGEPKLELRNPGDCIEIMTGAPVPDGADCVIKVEDTNVDGNVVRLNDDVIVKPGIGIHPQGSDAHSKQELLKAGRRMTAKEIAIAASIGKSKLLVAKDPRILIVTTGDELVDIASAPLPHQIRRSNDLSLSIALRTAGYQNVERHHLVDDLKETESFVSEALSQYDILILAGGVSKGKKDYLPDALERAGVRKSFQWVSQRPGKPLWFGTLDTAQHRPNVFALPGNPVSCFTCLHRYALPALNLSSGLNSTPTPKALLGEPFRFPPPLTLFLPAKLQIDEDARPWATPLPFNTSSDFISVASTDGFLELPSSQTEFEKGVPFPFYPWSV